MRHGAVTPAQVGEHRRLRRLDAEAHAAHPPVTVRPKSFQAGVLGIALDGDLGVSGPRNDVEDAQQLRRSESRRGPTAEEDGRSGFESVVLRPLDLLDNGVNVVFHQVVAVRIRGERAVVAPVCAERNVDVDAEGPHLDDRANSRASANRARASWRSTPMSTMGGA